LVGPGAPANLRSTAHRKAADPGHVFAEISAMFQAFGFAPRREDPVDHASVLSGFVGYLRLKEALARAKESADDAEIAGRIAALVVREHLAMLAEPVCQRLFECEAGYLAFAAQALLERVGRRPTDVEGGWAPAGLIFEGAGDDEITCG